MIFFFSFFFYSIFLFKVIEKESPEMQKIISTAAAMYLEKLMSNFIKKSQKAFRTRINERLSKMKIG